MLKNVMVAQIKNFKKQSAFIFKFWFRVAPPPPSQLVPNPFNWSPNTVFNCYLSNGRGFSPQRPNLKVHGQL